MRSRHDLGDDRQRVAARAAGMMLLAGGALAVLTALLPPGASGSDALILGLGAISLAGGAAALLVRGPVPEPLLGAFAVLGTALITIATREGGEAGTGTADNEMLYVWICLFCFNFLSVPHALAQLALVGLAYGWLLAGVPFDEAATRWLVTLATLLVAGLLVARLRRGRERLVDELADRASHDGLTGVLNRRALEERAIVELARARRDSTPLSLIVLDVDRFKELNDTHGHPAGDRVLRGVAHNLERETRQIDAIARQGGDEFAVLLPGASADDAVAVARRLLDSAHGDNGGGSTISVGVAAGPPPDHAFETLWRAADEAMYLAKRGGGNAIRIAGAPTAAA